MRAGAGPRAVCAALDGVAHSDAARGVPFPSHPSTMPPKPDAAGDAPLDGLAAGAGDDDAVADAQAVRGSGRERARTPRARPGSRARGGGGRPEAAIARARADGRAPIPSLRSSTP